MALITLRQLLDHAAEHGYGVPAFNINNMEQGLAILRAASETDAPVILQASRGARSYAGDIMLRHMVQALAEMNPTVPICLHQDHGNNLATCMSAIRHGFTSVMMDGSLHEDMKTPADYDYNVTVTARVAEAAHAVGASVEGELGVLGSLETGEAAAEDGSGAEGKLDESQLLTDPDQAVDFVRATGCDALAIACGSVHAMRSAEAELDIERIQAIHAAIPETPLVLHGSSGVKEESEVEAIKHGISKINVATMLNQAFTRALRETLAALPVEESDPRKFLLGSRDAVKEVVRHKMRLFGSSGTVTSSGFVSPTTTHRTANIGGTEA